MRETLKLIGISLGVTVVGLVIGAALVSPVVSMEHKLYAGMGVAAALVLWMLALAVRGVRRMMQTRRARGARTALATRPVTGGMPAIKMTGRAARTPRAVQALAAAGAEPTEIAWKTGLPVDAVAMLLELGGPMVAAR
ncbi:MAG: hypothetical protein IBJ03_19190 [Gemmatimonadaceae bacterium]|nr:hypothetical protein [Gemmatimonadaceae bacterium]